MSSTGLASAVRPLAGPDRFLRSLAAALVCVAAAGVGHHSAGGAMAPAAVLAVFLGAGAVAWLLAAHRVTPGQMVGLLVLCQVAVHLSTPSDEMVMSAAMVTAHLAATVVSAWALARGEAFVWQLADRLGIRAFASVVVASHPYAAAPVPVTVPVSRQDVRLAHSRAVRGPPSRSL